MSSWPAASAALRPWLLSASAESNMPTMSRPVLTGLVPGLRFSPGGMTMSKKPSIISSHDWSPQRTDFVGSGFARLCSELSNTARQKMTEPGGSLRGSASRYRVCQLKSYAGTSSSISRSPFGCTSS